MIADGREISPAQSFMLVRKVEAGMSDGGIAMPGQSGEKLVVVESTPYWVTTAGAKIEVSYRPGDEIVLRPPRKIGESSVGKPIIDGPQIHSRASWPKDLFLVALADIVAVERAAESDE